MALDMDGTIYRGGTLLPCTNPFLDLLRQLDISYSFLTNNSSKSVAEYAARLRKMGVPAEPTQIFISTQATMEYLKTEQPKVRRLFLLGSSGMAGELQAAGYTLTEDSALDEPDAVLVGFDLDLDFSRLCRAAYWIKQGKLFVASHPDRVCPTDQPTVIVDCGAICAALQSATGRAPDAVPGKPDPRMLLGLCRRLAFAPEELAMVGDRIYTDIEMARQAGVLGVLVLSGEATAADAAANEWPLDLIVRDLEEFGQHLCKAREKTP